MAQNGLGVSVASLMVVVQPPLLSVNLEINQVALGTPTQITVRVYGSADFTLVVGLGYAISPLVIKHDDTNYKVTVSRKGKAMLSTVTIEVRSGAVCFSDCDCSTCIRWTASTACL